MTYVKEFGYYDEVDELKDICCWVSLYAIEPFYGGPEEGGWWGKDQRLVWWKAYSNKHEAEQTMRKIEAFIKMFNSIERTNWYIQCEKELDIADAIGMNVNRLFGETSGPMEYECFVEENLGSNENHGSRLYE
jgi:hypothetical protein